MIRTSYIQRPQARIGSPGSVSVSMKTLFGLRRSASRPQPHVRLNNETRLHQ